MKPPIYFLSKNEYQAACYLHPTDARRCCRKAVEALERVHKGKILNPLDKWIWKSGANYYWLAYFADIINQKHFGGQDMHSRIKGLRLQNLPNQPCGELTVFPNFFNKQTYDFNSIIVKYRRAYSQARPLSKWGTYPAPKFVLFPGLTAKLPSRRGRVIPNIFRNLPLRPVRAANATSSRASRTSIRNGEILNPDGTPTGFRLYGP